MEVRITKTSTNRTHIAIIENPNESVGIGRIARFRLYAPNGQTLDSSNFRQKYGNTWEFDIENYPEYFISPYPNQSFGSFNVALETRTALVNDDSLFREEVKLVGNTYSIYSNDVTKPTLTEKSINSEPRLLNDSALFIKTMNGAKVTAQAEAKFNASISKIEWQVLSNVFQNGETSPIFSTFGDIPITITATDTRGLVGIYTYNIKVYDYQKPSILPVAGATSVLVARSLSNGTLSDRGTYIKVEVQKKYLPVNQKNTCKLMYRVKEQGEGKNWSTYTTLLDNNSSSNEFKGTLIEYFDISKRYAIELYAVDTLGNSETLNYLIASEKVFMDRRGETNSIAFGGHIVESNGETGVFEVYQKAFLKGGLVFVDPTTEKRYSITVENGALKVTLIT